MKIGSGGSVVGSAQITDGAIVNADINNAAAIDLTKLAGLIGNPGNFVSIDVASGATYSLTTVANQKVFVLAVITGDGSGGFTTARLKYNAVDKDTRDVGYYSPEAWTAVLMYSEIPGAGTQNVTVTMDAGTVTNCRMVIVKLKIG